MIICVFYTHGYYWSVPGYWYTTLWLQTILRQTIGEPRPLEKQDYWRTKTMGELASMCACLLPRWWLPCADGAHLSVCGQQSWFFQSCQALDHQGRKAWFPQLPLLQSKGRTRRGLQGPTLDENAGWLQIPGAARRYVSDHQLQDKLGKDSKAIDYRGSEESSPHSPWRLS